MTVLYPFLNFDTVSYNSTPEKNTNIWRTERVGIGAIKFEAARIQFVSDVFVAVPIVSARKNGPRDGATTIFNIQSRSQSTKS